MNFRFRKAPFYFTGHMVHLKIVGKSQPTDRLCRYSISHSAIVEIHTYAALK